MPLLDITNPEVIKFLIENYDKTTRLRMKWNILYADKLEKAATLDGTEKGYYETDVLKQAILPGLDTISRDHIAAGNNRRIRPIRDGVHIPRVADMRKGHSIPEVGLGDTKEDARLARPDTDLSADPIMRPVVSRHKQIVYESIPENGRWVYLKNRYRFSPEEKFYFRECSGWEYGWRLNDSCFGKNEPRHGLVYRLSRDVKSLSGPQPDPKHYKNPELPGPSKCMI